MTTGTYPIPHLTMSSMGPLMAFEEMMLLNVAKIEHWFAEQWQKTPALLTVSVDLRHSGYKLAPVDTNLFPAGYNNLNPELMPLCVFAAQTAMRENYPNCLSILIYPEQHTRNQYYQKSLRVLEDIWLKAGYHVSIGTSSVESSSSLVVLNNDLSDGVPVWLSEQSLPVEPPLKLGWSRRKKSQHFSHYAEVTTLFAEFLAIDPWLLAPLFSSAEPVDFMSQVGMEQVAMEVDKLLHLIQIKYDKYHIKEEPYVVVKADNGTYGMNVMMVFSGDEMLRLNRKQRTRMSFSKGRQAVHSVLIQEGVYTFESMSSGAVAEPVVYLIGPCVVGGFYRVHHTRDVHDNLNTPGMHFEPLAFAKACNLPSQAIKAVPNRFYVYGVVARLAALAAAREKAELLGYLV